MALADAIGKRGLSPRVRGNPPPPPLPPIPPRSIPACAGEPGMRLNSEARGRVYPRVCGGTGDHPRIRVGVGGLSPRVRGNLQRVGWRRGADRSIPACAGEPSRRLTISVPDKVYPRVCGGTALAANRRRLTSGLSPRVRGNLTSGNDTRPGIGSIPACAGEPRSGYHGCPPRGVYPRVCGGTFSADDGLALCFGLSPRVRGNL